MSNLVWLASYPKSGNTWFRIFLHNLLDSGKTPVDINQIWKQNTIASANRIFDEALGFDVTDLSLDEAEALRPEVYRFISNQICENLFIKIHDAFYHLKDGQALVPADATKAVLYFIRNPLDVAVSFANHSGISIDKAIERMNNNLFCFCGKPGQYRNQLRQRLLSWSGHVKSWSGIKDVKLLFIRYEDMKTTPFETFSKAVRFMGMKQETKAIRRALAFSDFNRIRCQEEENGFVEKSPDCGRFFNRGESGYWQEMLTEEQVVQIITHHRETMAKFGYLDKQDNPVIF